MPSAQLAEQLAQALLLEQVHYYKKQLLTFDQDTHSDLSTTPSNIEPSFILQSIDLIYANAQHIQLKQAIEPEQLYQVVQKYAFELNLGGELLEFIGVAARRVYLQLSTSNVSLQQLISTESFEFWLSKCVELDTLRHKLSESIEHSPKLSNLCLHLINRILEQQTPWLDRLRQSNRPPHSIRTQLLSFLLEQQQQIELKVEQRLAQFILGHIAQYMRLSPQELTEIGMLIWDNIKDIQIKDFSSAIKADDVEDFFILNYEYWRELRQHQGLQDLILSIVHSFYAYFAEYSLQDLLHAVGLNQQDLHSETLRFAPHFIRSLEQHGLLEPVLNHLLSPFFTRAASLDLIQQHLDQVRHDSSTH